MRVSTKALLLALCLLLAIVFQAPSASAQTDNPAADSEESSEESSEVSQPESSAESSAESSTESSTESSSEESSAPKEVHESAASEVTNKNGAKITIISNSNTLNSLAKTANVSIFVDWLKWVWEENEKGRTTKPGMEAK